MKWGHWDNPVIYMSRATAREVWVMFYGTEPDLSGDLRFGRTQIPVLFDDRMALGEARLEEDPDRPAVRARSCPNCHSIGTPRVLDRPRDGKPRAYCRDPWHDTTGE